MTVAIDHLLTRPATLLVRAPATEDDGGDWTYVETGEPVLVELQPVTVDETVDGGIQTGRWRVFLPASTPATGWDALTLDGETYELDGDPAQLWNPLTRAVHHLEADVVKSR